MSTLYSFSCMLGRAMNLPPVFFRQIPLTDLLDTELPMPRIPLLGSMKRSNRGRRGTRRHTRPLAAGSPTAAHSGSRQIVLEGPIEQGAATKFAINGTDFIVSAGTWIIGDLRFGVPARVKGLRMEESQLQASSVVVIRMG